MQALLAQPDNPLGLQAFVTDFRRKAENRPRPWPTGAFAPSKRFLNGEHHAAQ